MIGLEIAAGASGVSVALPVADIDLAAPLVTPSFAASVALPAATLALAAPTVTPAGSGAATIALPVAQLTLAAPLITPGVPAAGGTAAAGDSDRSGLLRKPVLW
jgi:hypothetical protein